MTCCLLEKAEMEWGTPPPLTRPLGRRRFFRRFSVHFCVALEPLFFKRQNVDEESAENLHKNLRKNLRTKNLHTNLRKSLRTKNLRKNGCKNLRKNLPVPKICAKKRFEHSVFWKMQARKK